MSENNKIILYQDDNEIIRVSVRFSDEDLWLTQNQLAEIYCTTQQNISQHVDNIYKDGELFTEATNKKFLLVRREGNRQVRRNIDHYNLDMVIALGYRVQSQVATRFRRWATQRLHEYIQKGFAMDDERLKQGGNRYFRELLQRIRDIRSSERNFYQQVTDIYATATDYDPRDEMTKMFFATVQNKLHYAVPEVFQMKLNHKFVRTVTTTAAVLGAAAMLSVGAFAAEADINDPAAAGYLPPQEQMVQGDIALHSADVAIGEKDPTYGGYGAPEGNPIQGNIMLISGDELAAPSADAAAKKSEARYTVKGLFGREVLYTARQKDGVLTLDVPAGSATFRTTVQDMQTLLNEGVSTLVIQTEKGSTTLNLSLLVEGQKGTDRVVLRRLGENTFLTVGLRCRRDLIVGR